MLQRINRWKITRNLNDFRVIFFYGTFHKYEDQFLSDMNCEFIKSSAYNRKKRKMTRVRANLLDMELNNKTVQQAILNNKTKVLEMT